MANIFETLGFDKDEAENLKVRADLMNELIKFIESKGLKQREAAELFKIHQSLVSDLVRGKINRFTVDKLINMAAVAGLKVSVSIEQAA